MLRKTMVFLLLALAANGSRIQATDLNQSGRAGTGEFSVPAIRLLESIADEELRDLSRDVLERNPALEALTARADAVRARAPQTRSLPDPWVSVTGFLGTPETRVGPQQFSVGLVQGLPSRGKRSLQEQAVLLEALAIDGEVESARLRLLTESRRLGHELHFLDRHEEINRDFRDHLIEHEEIARARYATGAGFGQGVVKLQAEITRVEKRLLDIERQGVDLKSRLNALRDRPADTEIPVPKPVEIGEIELDAEGLVTLAKQVRPELAAAAARIERGRILGEVAVKARRPDFKVGFVYTAVGSRDDAVGRQMPPEGNGGDIFGIQGGISLPVRRTRLDAMAVEAQEIERAAKAERRGLLTGIENAIGNLVERQRLDWKRVRLLEDLLLAQAEESRDSARAGYVSGGLNALDLFDAEHVLFETRTAIARAKTDYLVDLARLEGEIAAPVENLKLTEISDE